MRPLPLARERAWRLPLLEVSGLGERLAPEGDGRELLAVGDESFTLATGVLTLGDTQVLAPRHPAADLESIVRASGVPLAGGPEWEAVAGGPSRRVYVLQEDDGDGASAVLVFRADLSALEGRVGLDIADGGRRPENWRRKWIEDDNARGEAILVLRQGHVLVAKQRDPIRFIEFGPPGDRANGLSVATLLGASEPLGAGVDRLEALADWPLGEELRSVNDLAVAEDGGLYALSADSRLIAALDPTLSPGDRSVRVKRLFSVPDDIPRPEGLLMVGGHPVVGSDHDDPEADNVFLLEAMPR
jgi:hypothetical protein